MPGLRSQHFSFLNFTSHVLMFQVEHRPGLVVRWTPGEASELQAEGMSHEVLLSSEGTAPVRQTCPGRSRGCTFHASLPSGKASVMTSIL